jgi:hypothetical protein
VKQKYVGQLVSLKVKRRKDPIKGFVLDFNENWVLLERNVVDYVIDGFVIVRADIVVSARRGEGEKFSEAVIRAKGRRVGLRDKVPLGEVQEILSCLTSNFGIFSIDNRSGTACNLGRLIKVEGVRLTVETLSPKGKWDDKMSFDQSKIKVIEFDTDYVRSLNAFSQINLAG